MVKTRRSPAASSGTAAKKRKTLATKRKLPTSSASSERGKKQKASSSTRNKNAKSKRRKQTSKEAGSSIVAPKASSSFPAAPRSASLISGLPSGSDRLLYNASTAKLGMLLQAPYKLDYLSWTTRGSPRTLTTLQLRVSSDNPRRITRFVIPGLMHVQKLNELIAYVLNFPHSKFHWRNGQTNPKEYHIEASYASQTAWIGNKCLRIEVPENIGWACDRKVRVGELFQGLVIDPEDGIKWDSVAASKLAASIFFVRGKDRYQVEAEGIFTTKCIHRFSKRRKPDMPLPRLVEDADKLCKPSDLRGRQVGKCDTDFGLDIYSANEYLRAGRSGRAIEFIVDMEDFDEECQRKCDNQILEIMAKPLCDEDGKVPLEVVESEFHPSGLMTGIDLERREVVELGGYPRTAPGIDDLDTLGKGPEILKASEVQKSGKKHGEKSSDKKSASGATAAGRVLKWTKREVAPKGRPHGGSELLCKYSHSKHLGSHMQKPYDRGFLSKGQGVWPRCRTQMQLSISCQNKPPVRFIVSGGMMVIKFNQFCAYLIDDSNQFHWSCKKYQSNPSTYALKLTLGKSTAMIGSRLLDVPKKMGWAQDTHVRLAEIFQGLTSSSEGGITFDTKTAESVVAEFHYKSEIYSINVEGIFAQACIDDMSATKLPTALLPMPRVVHEMGIKGFIWNHKDESRGKRSVEETNQFIRDGRYFNAHNRMKKEINLFSQADAEQMAMPLCNIDGTPSSAMSFTFSKAELAKAGLPPKGRKSVTTAI